MVLRIALVFACCTSVWAQFECPAPESRLNGDNSMVPTTVPPNTNCVFKFTNNDATSYEDIQVVATKMGTGDEVLINGPFNRIQSDEGSQNFNFHAAMPMGDLTFSIFSSNTSDMTFSYYLRKAFLPNVGKPTQLSAPAGGMAQFLQTRDLRVGDLYEVTSTTIVALSAAAPLTTSPYDFLNVFVYDGTGTGNVILGSLYNALKNPIVSSKNSVTLRYVLPTADTFVGTIIANDDQNIANCAYEVAWISPPSGSPSIINYTLDATNGPVCLTLLNNADGTNAPYLGGNVPGANGETLTVVDGAPGGITLATYQNSNYFSLPQNFPGFARTFMLDKSTVNLNFYFDAVSVNDHIPVAGRKGFFMTQNFGFTSNQQNALFYVNSSTPFNVTFNIAQSSQAPGAYMDVYTTNNKKKIDLSNVDPSVSHSFADTLVDIDIIKGPTSHTGYYVTYQITDVDKDEILCPGGNMTLQGSLYLPLGIVPPNFDCKFTFLYDSSSFAVLSVIAKNIGSGDQVTVMSVTDTISANVANFSMTAAFPPSQVTVYVKSGANTSMHFGYSAEKKPANVKHVNVRQQNVNGNADFIQLKNSVSSIFEIKAQTAVALIASIPPTVDPTNLLNIFVYEGTGNQKQLVGTLYSMYNNLYTSSLNSISFYCAQGGFVGTVVVNDKQNLNGCASYTTQWAYNTPSGPFGGRVQIDATSGTACVTILNEYDENEELPTNAPYFKNWDSQNSPNPRVVTGAPLQNQPPETILGNMGAPSTFSAPQYFPGFARTIFLDSGSLDINLAFSSFDAWDSNAYDGRIGFIVSDNYQYMAALQDANFGLTLMQPFNFTFNIVRTNAPLGANITVYGSNDTEPALVVDLTVDGFQRSYSIFDTIIELQLNGGEGVENLGTYITYSVSVPDSTPTSSTTSGPGGQTGASVSFSTVSELASSSVVTDAQTTTTTVATTTTTKSATTITGILALLAAVLYI